MCVFVYVSVCLCACIVCFLYVCVTLCMCVFNLCVIIIHSTIQWSRPFLYAIPWFVNRCMGNTLSPVIALS